MSLPIPRLCTIFALAFCFGSPAYAIVNVLPVPGKEVSGLSALLHLKAVLRPAIPILSMLASVVRQSTEVSSFRRLYEPVPTMEKNQTKSILQYL